MAQLFYGKITWLSATATSAAAGYPASSAILEAIGRQWRSATVGAEEWVGNFAAGTFVHTFALHDVNFASANIQVSVGGGAFATVGVMTTYADRHGRRRGRITINTANVTSIKVQVAAGTPTDSTNTAYWAGAAPTWRIGAAYAFASTVTPSAFPKYAMRRATKRPRVTSNLVNGAVSVAATGGNVDRVDLTFENQASEVVDDFIARGSAGTVWMDMGVAAAFPEHQWPVRIVQDEIDEDYPRPMWYAIGTLSFLEVV